MDEMKVLLRAATQREAGLRNELASCKKDVQLVDGHKEAGEQVQNLLTAMQGLSEAGEASGQELEEKELEKELSESIKRTKAVELRLQKAQFANKVIASDAEDKRKSIADLALRNSQQLVEIARLQKQIGIMQEVFRYAGIGSC